MLDKMELIITNYKIKYCKVRSNSSARIWQILFLSASRPDRSLTSTVLWSAARRTDLRGPVRRRLTPVRAGPSATGTRRRTPRTRAGRCACRARAAGTLAAQTIVHPSHRANTPRLMTKTLWITDVGMYRTALHSAFSVGRWLQTDRVKRQIFCLMWVALCDVW